MCDKNEKCILLNGHPNPCQTEVAPPLTDEEREIIRKRQAGELIAHSSSPQAEWDEYEQQRLEPDDLEEFNRNEAGDYP